MKELPTIIKTINKDSKTNKIAELDECHALELHRMFSGSVAIDYITGGGYGYRRVHILFGSRSSGKNATLNQTIAYNQRLCRYCHGIMPDFWDTDDRHAQFLRYVKHTHQCKCDNPDYKKFLFFDYEKSIAKEGPKEVSIKKIFDPGTENFIDEMDYTEMLISLEESSSPAHSESGSPT